MTDRMDRAEPGGDDGEPAPGDGEWDPQVFLDRHGYLSWLGADLAHLEDGRAVLAIEPNEEFENPVGSDGRGPVHGGIVASLIDTASAIALQTTFDAPEAVGLTTTDLNVSYLRPATGALRADASVVRAGGSTGVVQVDVDGDDGEAAVGRATYRLFRSDGDERG